jgi:membrane protein DedA with SNARE-associated domain
MEQVADSPLHQACLAALGTFILEDPTVITCGLLIADGRMGFWTAVAGLSVGITIGDLGLYLIGRFFGPWIRKRNWVSEESFTKAKSMLDKNLATALIASRFLPGTRIPVFVGSGLFEASPIKFLAFAIVASLLWTMFLLTVTAKIGEAILPLLGDLKWVVLGAVAAGFLLWRLLRKKRPT